MRDMKSHETREALILDQLIPKWPFKELQMALTLRPPEVAPLYKYTNL